MPSKICPACKSNVSLCICSFVELITPSHRGVLTWDMIPVGATTLFSVYVICKMNLGPPASQQNRKPLGIHNFTCPLQGLGLLRSLGHLPLSLDPNSLQGVYLGY